MPPLVRAPLSGLAIAVAATGATVGLLFALGPLGGGHLPFLLFLPAIAAAGWLCGVWAGAAATALGTFAIAFFWLPPVWLPAVSSPADVLTLAVFFLVGLLISALMEARHRSEQRFRQISETIDACFWITDALSRRILYLSPACVRLWGFDREAFYRDPMRWTNSIHVDDRERAVRAFSTKARSGPFDEEYRMLTPARGERWVRDRGFPVLDGRGRVRRIVGFTEDITDRVQAARALAEGRDREHLAHESLARAFSDVQRAERELARLLGEAQAANRAKDEFLAMLGHELRNPLGAIGSAVEVLEHLELPDERSRRATGVISRQVRQLARLMDDLLDVARVVTGKIALRLSALDLAEAARHAVGTLSSARQADRHSVVMDLQTAWVYADAARIEQVVTNLLANAFKYTPPGGLIHVSTAVADGHAVLQVRDSGAGIAPDLLPYIFDLFVQGARPLHRPQGGLGIGLTLVRRLIAMHQGTVHAASDGPGKGSTFTVRLPALASPAAVPAPAERASLAAGPLKILIVEDVDDSREMLRRLLELSGHEVAEADDGPTAVAQALDLAPDVVIVDVGLPGLDGYEVAARIRAGGGRMRLVALTGYGQDENRRRAAAAGFDAHLVKPVDRTRLMLALGQHPSAPAPDSSSGSAVPP